MVSADSVVERFAVDRYGYEPHRLLTSAGEVAQRLHAILSDKVLRFNPYSVDDDALLACAERGRWLPFPALTQMVVFHFHEIRTIEWVHPYEVMTFRVGNDPQVLSLPVSSLTQRLTYLATLRQVHVTVGGRSVTNLSMVEKMQGRDYFVSHALVCRKANGRIIPAYRMCRLKGDGQSRADTIRRSMVEAKISMLEELMAYPYCSEYLHCSRDFIDYATPVGAAIEAIRRFPLAVPRDAK